MVKVSKVCSDGHHRFTDQHCRNFMKFIKREIGEIVHYLTAKKIRLPLKLATAWIAPKICRGQPPTMCSVLHISSKSVYFWQSYSQTRKHNYFHDLPEAMLRFVWPVWLNGRAFARDPKGCDFKSRPVCFQGPCLGQDAHMHVLQSRSSIIWYRPMGSDAFWLGS